MNKTINISVKVLSVLMLISALVVIGRNFIVEYVYYYYGQGIYNNGIDSYSFTLPFNLSLFGADLFLILISVTAIFHSFGLVEKMKKQDVVASYLMISSLVGAGVLKEASSSLVGGFIFLDVFCGISIFKPTHIGMLLVRYIFPIVIPLMFFLATMICMGKVKFKKAVNIATIGVIVIWNCYISIVEIEKIKHGVIGLFCIAYIVFWVLGGIISIISLVTSDSTMSIDRFKTKDSIDIEESLDHLKDIHAGGWLTDKEYAEKRAELIEKI